MLGFSCVTTRPEHRWAANLPRVELERKMGWSVELYEWDSLNNKTEGDQFGDEHNADQRKSS